MKIEKKSVANVVLFENVPGGAVFKDKNGTIYMKLDIFYRNNSIGYNAIILESGSLVFFDIQDEKVEILEDAVLTY